MIVVIMWVVSTYFHDPETLIPFNMFGFKYTDIVHGLFGTIFKEGSERWLNPIAYSEFLSGGYKCFIPYIDYKLEYPPLIGLLWYASTCVAFNLTSDLQVAARIHYYIHAGVLLVFTVLNAFVVSEMVQVFRRRWIRVLLLLSPTMIIYLVYNWDIIAVSLAIMGLLLFVRRRYLEAGLLMGASFSAKILTIGIAFYLFLKLVSTRNLRKATRYIIGFTSTGMLPFIMLYLVAPQGFNAFIEHHRTWYCENCLYMIFIGDIQSEMHRKLFVYLSSGFILLLSLLLPPRKEEMEDIDLDAVFVYGTIPILFNYVFSPQMMVIILPLALLAVDTYLVGGYLLTDTINASLILLFFHELSSGGHPWTGSSMTQFAATLRNMTLLFILLMKTYSLVKKRYPRRSVSAV